MTDVTGGLTKDTLTIQDMDLSTVEGSQRYHRYRPSHSVDPCAARGLGCGYKTAENTIGNLQNISENVSAARGRIKDTDFAAETANLSKQQVMQQAGTAILAQGQPPQSVLKPVTLS